MGTKVYRVGYHFFEGKSKRSIIISLLGLSRLTHVVISIESPTVGIMGYNCSWGSVTSWFTGTVGVCPSYSVYEDLELELPLVDLILPPEEPYSFWKVCLHFLTGRPRHTLSCVEAVHRIRYIANKTTKGRTTGGLYRYLRREV